MKINEILEPINPITINNIKWSHNHGAFTDNSDSKLDEVMSFIDINCSEIIKSVKSAKKLLYRGIDLSKISATIFQGTTPLSRTPRGQSKKEQATFDNLLNLAGFKALRSQSISCTDNKAIGFGGGNTYAIFPLNGFSFAWSPTIEDVGCNTDLSTCLQIIWNNDIFNEKIADNFIRQMSLKNYDLENALLSGNEIWIHGSYIALSLNEYHTNLEMKLGVKL